LCPRISGLEGQKSRQKKPEVSAGWRGSLIAEARLAGPDDRLPSAADAELAIKANQLFE